MIVDTHALLWWLEDSPRLSRRARRLLQAPDGTRLWSVASSWEVAIKTSMGGLALPVPFQEFAAETLAAHRMELLPISTAHLVQVAGLPRHHRDPFDRMLVAQALAEGVPILTADPAFDAYDVELVW
jgi:PIN domain nuclease of toxin-antitoxin system